VRCGRDGRQLWVFTTTFNAGSGASLDELGPVEEWIPPRGVDVYVVVSQLLFAMSARPPQCEECWWGS
jgi:hypothetical protein